MRGLQALDDHTVRIRLERNFKYFLQFLAAEYAAIVPEDYAGLDEAVFRTRPVGTGPFRLAGSGEADHRLPAVPGLLERNPDYFEPMGNLDEIEFYSANTAIASAAKEYFDLLYISNSEIRELARKPDFKIINSSYSILNFLILNPNENSQMKERGSASWSITPSTARTWCAAFSTARSCPPIP